MKLQPSHSGRTMPWFREFIAMLCALLLVPGEPLLLAQQAAPQQAPAQQAAPQQAAAPAADEAPVKLPADQLDALVAPIALYPDPLLSQTLVASTYPLEIVQLQQWLDKNKGLKDKALDDAVKKQNWDPSVQGLAGLPDVVKRLASDISWTTDLGNAFLAQQSDVMDAVQRMRKKAQDAGNLKSSEQQKVETKVVESKQVIIVEQANPQVVYVPSYNPTVVYGPPVYPYPPIYYPPPPPPGYYAAGMAISFGVGVAMGAMWSGGWGYHCGWGGGNNVYINNNNNFVRNTNANINRNNVNNVNRGNNNTWQHNPQHRGGAPYSDRSTANKYGGTARGDSMASRQANARQNVGQSGGRAQAGTMERGGAGNRAGGPSAGTMERGGAGNRGGSPSPGTMERGDAGNRGGNPSASNMSRGGGGDRVGNRSVPSTPSGGNRSAFGGASSGMSGSSARASSQRGSSSFGGGGGGRSRGGGGGGRRR